MHKIAFFLFSFLSVAAFSQTNTYSPYSRYGLGDLSSQGLVSNKGMGGTGIGLRLPNSLNYLNPASYTTQDSLSFLFDFGLFSQVTDYKSKSGSGTDVNASLGHIVFGFPVTRWWNSAIGIVPYSRMGYDLVNYNSLFVYNYKGSGGLNKFFLGNGFRIKNLSVGVNLNVLFGSLEQSHSYMNEDETRVPVFPTERFQQQSVRSTSLAFGFQYNIKVSDDFSVVLGGILENKSRLITRNSLLITNTYSSVDTFVNPFTGNIYGERTSIDTIDFYNERKVEEHLPLLYGAGISLNYKNKLILAADYSAQKWSDYHSFNKFDTLVDTRYLNFGLQYTPDEKAIRSYWKRIGLRAGFYMNDTYLKVNGQQIQDYGVTFGLKFPFRRTRSSVQLSYQYGKRGTTDYNLLQENYHIINLSISLYDYWFNKIKFD